MKNDALFNFKIIIICLLLSIPFLFPISSGNYFAFEGTKTETLVNSNTSYNYIDLPNTISGNVDDFFVNDRNNNLYRFKQGALSSTGLQFENLVDFSYNTQTGKLFIIADNKIYEATSPYTNAVELGTDNPTSVLSCPTCDILTYSDSILITTEEETRTLQSYSVGLQKHKNFSNIVDACLYGNTIYLLDVNEIDGYVLLIKINLTDSKLSPIQVCRISENTTADFEINSVDNGLLILEDNTLCLYSYNGDFICDLLTENINTTRSFASGEVYIVSNFYTSNNKIIISDKISNSIQTFTLDEENNLVFEDLLVATFGSDNDRLYNAKNLYCITENELVIADTGNNRLVYQNTLENKIEILSDFENAPTLTASNNDKDIFVYAKPNIYIFNKSFERIKEIPVFGADLVDLFVDSRNILYALDAETDNLIYLDKNNQFQTIANIDDLSSNSKLKIDATNKTAYVLTDNKLYKINISLGEVNAILNNENYIDFGIDYKNNIFLLENVNSTCSIKKYDSNYSFVDSVELDGKYYVNLELNINSGTIFVIDNHYFAVVKIVIDDFIEDLIPFDNDLSFVNSDASKTIADVAKITSDTIGYRYPFMISPITDITADTLVIVLEKQCEANPLFAYCMITNQKDKNILVYIENEKLNYDIVDTKPTYDKVRIISAYTYLYKYPTTLKLEGQVDLKVERKKNDNTKSTLALNGETFEVVGTGYGICDYNNNSFYCVRLGNNNGYAYIIKSTAINVDAGKYVKTFQPNAHTSKINQNDIIEVYTQNGDTFESIGIELNENTKIYVAHYDTSSEYTSIVYQNDDKESVNAYIKTKYIAMETITPHIILGIILLLVSIVLIIVVLIFLVHTLKQRKLNKRLSTIDANVD